MISTSAPGKIILFGEHAVVYGQPALAVPVTQVQARVDVRESPRDGIHIEAPEIQLTADLSRLAPDNPIAAAINGVFSILSISSFPNLEIKISSTIPVASGLGSGAAVSVALIRALSSAVGQPFPDEHVSALAFQVEKLHHGTPSGIDNTVVTYARPVYFVKGQPIETFKVGKPFTVVIGDTGIGASTKESVGDVRKLWEADKPKFERMFMAIGSIVRTARQAVEGGHPDWLGPLMNENHDLLREMSVSSVELDTLVTAARGSGALGAKLSGGGRGGNMIALVESDQAEIVSKSLLDAGARGTIIAQVE